MKFVRLFSAAFVLCSGALPLYSATHLEVLDAIKQKWNSLPGVDANADNQELLAFVKTIPEFSDSWLDTRCSCVWAVFSDGPLVVLANNSKLQGPPPPGPPVTEPRSSDMSSTPRSQSPTLLAEPAAPTPSPVELPKSGLATLMNARGPDMPDPIPILRAWLTAEGYSPLSGENASVESLRNWFGGDGVFYFNTYGGWDEGRKNFLVATSTKVTPTTEADPDILADEGAKRLGFGVHDHYWNPTRQKWEPEALYWINADFIRRYWSPREFAQNSFVFIDACESALSDDFKQAFFDRKASVYAGWNESFDTNKSPEIAKFFFDRLLGGNHVVPEADGFKQRAFDYWQVGVGHAPEISSDADWHGMNDFPAFVWFTVNPAQTQTSFGLLAPSIASVFTNEVNLGIPPYTAGTLEISGIFGTDPRPDLDSKVTVGGVDCPVKPGVDGWQPDTIRCDLPAGAAGDVVVTVRKHDSNKAQLTKWNGTFNYSIVGDGSLQVSANYHAVFRADARKLRFVIHNPPIGPFFRITGLIPEESSASYTCSGSATRTYPGDPPTTVTITWTGGGNMPASRVAPPGPNSFQFTAAVGTPTVQFTSYYGPGPGCDWTRTTTPGGTETGHWDLHWAGLVDIGALPVEPNDPSFPAGSMNFATCGSPPTPILTPDPQCRMQWDAITASSPPDATSAR